MACGSAIGAPEPFGWLLPHGDVCTLAVYALFLRSGNGVNPLLFSLLVCLFVLKRAVYGGRFGMMTATRYLSGSKVGKWEV